MLAAISMLVLGGLAAALLLAWLARNVEPDTDALVESVNEVLPQIQCAQCGYPGCRPYAQAVVHQDAPINRCPPGGEATLIALAALMNRPTIPIDTSLAPVSIERVALIDESVCIGCALCLPACPVDAIVGAHQFMHTVVSVDCTGCELCLAPCPVDCIAMVKRPAEVAA